MIDDLWAFWMVGYVSFLIGLLNSRLLRGRQIWDEEVDMDELALASREGLEGKETC